MKSISVVLLVLLSASMAFAQSGKVDIVPLRIGGVDVSFPLESDETGVVPTTEAGPNTGSGRYSLGADNKR